MNQYKNKLNLINKALKDPNRAMKVLSYKLLSTFGHNNYKKFIVLTRSRTGSNMLISYLDSHPNIHADREVFARLNGRHYKDILSKTYGKQPRHVKFAGFKIFYYHPMDDDKKEIWDYLINSKEISVIHLKRRNILRTMISRKIAGNIS